MEYTIKTAGDSAVCLEFEQVISEKTSSSIRLAAESLGKLAIPGIVDVVPTFCALLISYDPLVIDHDQICQRLNASLLNIDEVDLKIKHIVEIPVCYGGEYGPDIDFVANHAGLTVDEVIAIHCGRDYLIDMLGFLPGFAYLGGLDPRIHSPRLEAPRTRVEPGAVGIGGAQTGIYPLASPAGWRIIGNSPVRPYDPDREKPILYKAGDYIRFVPITAEEYARIEVEVADGTYECTFLTEGV
ncbi:MAG: 5-oxoprolinase subunit PxpB [bacterium]|nr:5-oxoprolinase subunit PxpB [bacterium]